MSHDEVKAFQSEKTAPLVRFIIQSSSVQVRAFLENIVIFAKLKYISKQAVEDLSNVSMGGANFSMK